VAVIEPMSSPDATQADAQTRLKGRRPPIAMEAGMVAMRFGRKGMLCFVRSAGAKPAYVRSRLGFAGGAASLASISRGSGGRR
jgi:hypothetical protein